MTILIATSTAVAVIVLALLLSKLVRTAVERGSATTEASFEFPATLVARHVDTGRSIDVKFRQSKFGQSESQAGEEPQPASAHEASDDGSTPAYRQVGDEVTAVLSAAEQAAAQIRETALRDAERTRVDADETRAAADAYAEETRRSANEQAARKLSQAEEQARRIQVEAEEMGRELEAEARRRGDALAKSTEGMEARIESVLTVFRGVVAELEELLPAEKRSRAAEPDLAAAKQLDEALNPASWHG